MLQLHPQQATEVDLAGADVESCYQSPHAPYFEMGSVTTHRMSTIAASFSGNPPITRPPVAGRVVVRRVQHDRQDAEDGHQQHKLKRALLAAAHEEPVHPLRRQAAGAVPERRLQHEAVHLDLHLARAAHVAQAQRQEGVDDERLIAAQDSAFLLAQVAMREKHQRLTAAKAVIGAGASCIQSPQQEPQRFLLAASCAIVAVLVIPFARPPTADSMCMLF